MAANALRYVPRVVLLTIAIGGGCAHKPTVAGSAPVTSSPAPAAPSSDSGVYGFSGARIAEGAQEGVIGECIWVFDESNRRQIATATCGAEEPGRFRVRLRPGRYVLRGPGGNRPVEVPPGQWIKVTSLVELPLAP